MRKRLKFKGLYYFTLFTREKYGLGLFLISLCCYGLMAFGIERSNFWAFISIFALLFICYWWSLKGVNSSQKMKWALTAAIFFRLTLIFSLPGLSDDFYRFIWDGNLWAHGINPFAQTPEFYMQNGLPEFLSAELFQHLNSQAYYTVYPPVCQFIYGLSACMFGTHLLGNVIVMKGILLGFEIGTFWVMKKLLDHFGLSPAWLLIYALNPLIILELTGNLHFEAVMIFFLLLSYYFFLNDKRWFAALSFMLAVNTKLIPLLLVPYLVFSLGWKRSAGLIAILVAGTLTLHLPFLNQTFIQHFSDSLTLYFQSFEFNASLYYLVRWVGFQLKGYNIIHTAAPRLVMLSSLIIVSLSWKHRQASLKDLPVMAIVIFGFYYLFSTTVHPWYVSLLLAFVPFTGLLFPVAWSAVIQLTYITYVTADYTENLWLVAIEYIIVLGVMGVDAYHRKESVKQKMVRIFPLPSSLTNKPG